MSRLTWAFVSANPKLVEVKQATMTPTSFACPFCELIKSRGRLVEDYRCRCGALFYNSRPLAVKLK
jgi:hypothetical protein